MRVLVLTSVCLLVACATPAASARPCPDPAAAAAAPSGPSLYDRLGGHAGIKGALTKVIENAVADPTLAPYFVFQTTTPPPEPGHPTAGQVIGCLTELLAKVAGGPAAYPTKLADGYQCRDMVSIHQPFGIGGGEFDLFASIAQKTLAELKVPDADVQAVMGALGGTKAQIVRPAK